MFIYTAEAMIRHMFRDWVVGVSRYTNNTHPFFLPVFFNSPIHGADGYKSVLPHFVRGTCIFLLLCVLAPGLRFLYGGPGSF